MMSSPDSAKVKSGGKKTIRPKASRCPSASEIARNLKHFEVWSVHQNCEQVSYSDVPVDLKADVAKVFDISTGKLPSSWLDSKSPEFKSLSQLATGDFLEFLKEIHASRPELFCDKTADVQGLFSKMTFVHSAWKRLNIMRKSKERWSEADYAANVYNVFRSPAIRESTHRVQCAISLPQPLVTTNLGTDAARILGTKTSSPDCLVMIPSASIRSLSVTANSAYQVLKRHKNVTKSGNATKCSSFRYQSTPCVVPPENPAFQFISSFWEDKKPLHNMLDDAYRQNRMSTAAAVRHLHSLHVNAPVFGLVWASGTVRAHVDWCRTPQGKQRPAVVYSAPYQRTAVEDDEREADIFHEWQLDRASDIVEVFFLIENIDHWTMSGFRDKVVQGVNDLVDSVVEKSQKYEPWKRVGDLIPSAPAKENKVSISASTTSSAQSTPPQKPRGRKLR